jgi:recombinational DNA repair protein (RecF pathway)
MILGYNPHLPRCLKCKKQYEPDKNASLEDYAYCFICNGKEVILLVKMSKEIIFNSDYKIRPAKRQKTQERSKKSIKRRLREIWEKE